ncbi:MAG: type II toxin-antitoxin system HicA family toxin [Gammaproteobacteria bacterium]|nr:type II toxin-antitoxin system HicA family toxin [Gammaproteobacteria bacterium]
MSKLTPLDYRKLVRIFESVGFTVERQKGSHIVMSKPGVARPVVFPKSKNVGVDIIKNNMRTAGISREQFFELLKGS